MNRIAAKRAAPQCGQALTEMLVLCLALLPLMSAIIVIGRFQALARATDMASSFAAFDATRGPSLPDLRTTVDELRALFYALPSTPLNDATLGERSLPTPPFWVDRADRPLFRNTRQDVQVLPGEQGSSSGSALDESVGNLAFFPVASVMTLPAGGLYRVHVRLSLAPAWASPGSTHADTIPALTLERSGGVLIQTWRASGPREVEQRVEADPLVFPGPELQGLGLLFFPLILDVDRPGFVMGPTMGSSRLWTDMVPPDRLLSGGGA
jgi:hypothetical protein